ncbi:MAG: hypothetical protein K0U84_14145 [Actinomycetia bacterium]|nr:hypothetical protein [Actinomycetes bacterium]
MRGSDAATEAYVALHWGNEVDEVVEVQEARYAGETVVELGKLTSVTYTTAKGTREQIDFIHDFEDPTPRLCVDEDNRLCILGGGYIVTEAGIEG